MLTAIIWFEKKLYNKIRIEYLFSNEIPEPEKLNIHEILDQSIKISKISFGEDINFIKEFDHNHILMVNGKLENSELKFEDKNKIKIKS